MIQSMSDKFVHCNKNQAVEMGDTCNIVSNDVNNEDDDDKYQTDDSSSFSSCETVIIYQESYASCNNKPDTNMTRQASERDEEHHLNDHVFKKTIFAGEEQILNVTRLIESDRVVNCQIGSQIVPSDLIEIDLNSSNGDDDDDGNNLVNGDSKFYQMNELNRTKIDELHTKNPTRTGTTTTNDRDLIETPKTSMKRGQYNSNYHGEPPISGLVLSGDCLIGMHNNRSNCDISRDGQERLVCTSRRLRDYFESIKYRSNNESRHLYQFFKSVRTELVASLLFSFITAQALITIRSSRVFRSGNDFEDSKFSFILAKEEYELANKLHLSNPSLSNIDQDSTQPPNYKSNMKEEEQLNNALVNWDRTSVQLVNSLVLALLIASLTQIFGHISGAHLAPAISIGLYVKGYIGRARLGAYLGAQALGSLLGLILLALLTSSQLNLEDANRLSTSHSASISDIAEITSKLLRDNSDQLRLLRMRRSALENSTEIGSKFKQFEVAQAEFDGHALIVRDLNPAITSSKIVIIDEPKANQINESEAANTSLSGAIKLKADSSGQVEDELIGSAEPRLESLLVSLMDEINLERDLRKAKSNNNNETSQIKGNSTTSKATNITGDVPDGVNPASTYKINATINVTQWQRQQQQISRAGTIQDSSRPSNDLGNKTSLEPIESGHQTTLAGLKIQMGPSKLVNEDKTIALMQPTNEHYQKPIHNNLKRVLGRRALLSGHASQALQSLVEASTDLKLQRPLKRDLLLLSPIQTTQATQDAVFVTSSSKPADKSAQSGPRPVAPSDQSGEIALQATTSMAFQLEQQQSPFADYLTINLLGLALPESVMSSSSLSECFAKTSAIYNNNKHDYSGRASRRQVAVSKTTIQANNNNELYKQGEHDDNNLIKSSNKSDTRQLPANSRLQSHHRQQQGQQHSPNDNTSGRGDNLLKEQLFSNCLNLSNGAQMFLLQFLASLLIVLGYLINADPRRSDAGFRALSIGFVYFVSNLLTIQAGSFFPNPFHVFWLSRLASGNQEWQSEWITYFICPLVAGLFGAMSHDYLDFVSDNHRGQAHTQRNLHLRRSFSFSLNEFPMPRLNQSANIHNSRSMSNNVGLDPPTVATSITTACCSPTLHHLKKQREQSDGMIVNNEHAQNKAKDWTRQNKKTCAKTSDIIPATLARSSSPSSTASSDVTSGASTKYTSTSSSSSDSKSNARFSDGSIQNNAEQRKTSTTDQQVQAKEHQHRPQEASQMKLLSARSTCDRTPPQAKPRRVLATASKQDQTGARGERNEQLLSADTTQARINDGKSSSSSSSGASARGGQVASSFEAHQSKYDCNFYMQPADCFGSVASSVLNSPATSVEHTVSVIKSQLT